MIFLKEKRKTTTRARKKKGNVIKNAFYLAREETRCRR